MNRRLEILALLVLASGSVAAQAAPDTLLIKYNVANQHTYFITPSGLDWQTARAYSHSFGGYLVSIGDSAEQAFLASKYGSMLAPCWIGLSDAASEGVWTWDSGEPVTYTNWCQGEPNNFGGDEDYVELFTPDTGFSGCWNDIQ